MNDNLKCTCSGPLCACGALGIVKDGGGVRVAASMMDGAPRSTIADGMTIDVSMIDAEAAKPEYDDFRGMFAHDGTPLPQHFAFLNLMKQTPAAQRAAAAYDSMVDGMRGGYQVKTEKPSAPQFARDGRPLAMLSDVDRARETMILEQTNAWRT